VACLFLGGSRAIRYTPRPSTQATLLWGAAAIPAARAHLNFISFNHYQYFKQLMTFFTIFLLSFHVGYPNAGLQKVRGRCSALTMSIKLKVFLSKSHSLLNRKIN
jgi:hypothetical protein